MSEIKSGNPNRPLSPLQSEEQFDLESRLTILENWKESMQVGILESMTK